MKIIILKSLPAIDFLLSPFVYVFLSILKKIRLIGLYHFPYCKKAIFKIGVFPILNHYYEPQFDFRESKQPLSQDRMLQGIKWNTAEQRKLLSAFSFSHELLDIPKDKTDKLEFYLNNGSFGSGDAEFWYQLIRLIKPKRIIEVGSGNSTLMAIKAIEKNIEQDPNFQCKHVCIEPYEMPWLEKTGVSVERKKIEDVELSFFSQLEKNDILFIDSSHIIRPQGDVLYEYLELLPTLKEGVIVHIHDIFSPRNYPKEWIEEGVLFWNEQYLLEAFLSHNNSWKILGALNYLQHNYHDDLKSVTPFLTSNSEPGSFYIQKIA